MKRLLTLFALLIFVGQSYAKQIDVLLITGQTDKYHCWEMMYPVLESSLAEYDKFNTTTIKMVEGEEFTPNFEPYDVVVLNINDVKWSDKTKANFEQYMANGGGMVVVHEADNAFPEWKEFNKMIGLGGWAGRNEKDGPYYYWKDGEYVRDMTPGAGGRHGKRVPFDIIVRNQTHPIMKGLPAKWTHLNDELYGSMRGPAENIDVLATAFSTKSTGGTDKEEPVLFTISYGKGRVFHTVLGHTGKEFKESLDNRGFQVTFSRGTEWAATGKVKQKSSF
ncbi:MAG: ThuA domain-containing protein [Rikenellaceae bacterium]